MEIKLVSFIPDLCFPSIRALRISSKVNNAKSPYIYAITQALRGQP